MNLACVIAIAFYVGGEVSPRPAPSNWVSHAEPTGIESFDNAVISAVNRIRKGDWKAVARLSLDTVIFESRVLDDSDPGGDQLLFDESRASEEEAMSTVKVKQLVVDPSEPTTNFVQTQFSYFATLIESTVQNTNAGPKWTLSGPKDLNGVRCGPSVWGRIASNASWRIEFDSTSSGFKISKFVVESR